MTSREDGMRDRRKFKIVKRLKVAVISWLGWAAVWLVNWSVRYRIEDFEPIGRLREAKIPFVAAFWHNQIFQATYVFRFSRIVVITSRHFDGEYIARIIRRFGFGAARGSSSRGAVRAVLELRRYLITEGREVAFTIDGPRGPIYRVKPGPIFLVQKTGLPLVTFHIQPQHFWELNSWDRFRIPKPFTKAVVKMGRLLDFHPDDPPEECLEALQAELDRLREYCENYDWDSR
jgi:lysophospholipid acyltransferase (LPLAT)-like uncharacterized protein